MGRNGQAKSLDYCFSWVNPTLAKFFFLQALEKQTKLESSFAERRRVGERDPIREALMRLGKHFLEQGDITNALANFQDTKEYNNSAEQSADTCLAVIKASVATGTFSHVKVHGQRALTIASTCLSLFPCQCLCI